MSDVRITLELSGDEALVLSEFLSRFGESGELRIEDQAEVRVLWDIQASLEKLLTQPFMPDYREQVLEARKRVRDE